MSSGSAEKRYNRRVSLLGLAYALLLGAHGLIRSASAGNALAWLAAILPALPIIGIFGALGRYLVEERDEFIRQLAVRQIIVATGLTLSLATMWGFVESDDLVPHVETYFVAALWFAGLGVGSILNRLHA